MLDSEPANNYRNQLEREGQRWATKSQEREIKRSWLQSSVVLQRANRRVTGDESIPWLQWVDKEFLSQTERKLGLSLGCNDGLFERQLVRTGICQRLDGMDVSPQAITLAQEAAAQENIPASFAVADVNNLQLPRERYDMVFAVMAMHHFASLEHVLGQINRTLKPNGFLVLNEFVGPSRFQWTEQQLSLANDALHLLPPNRRRLRDGSVREVIVAPDTAEMERTDPFEAIRSADIISQVNQHLDIVARRDYGGTILHLVLHDIVHNFDETQDGDCELLNMLCGIEEIALKRGLIDSDFTVIVARKRRTSNTAGNHGERQKADRVVACDIGIEESQKRISQLEATLEVREGELRELESLLRAIERGIVLRLLNLLQGLRRRARL